MVCCVTQKNYLKLESAKLEDETKLYSLRLDPSNIPNEVPVNSKCSCSKIFYFLIEIGVLQHKNTTLIL